MERRPFSRDDAKSPPPDGALDRLIRRFARPAYLAAIVAVYAVSASALAIAFVPALACGEALARLGAGRTPVLRWLAAGAGVGVGFFVFGFALLAVIAAYNLVLPTRVKPFKGGYYRLAAVPWLLHNALFYVVRFTFLPWITLTPFGVWFLRAMGMRIGRHAFVNTDMISDPRLITLGADVAVGGGVRLFAHYGGGGNLVVAPVVIEDRATLGVGVTVMGDVRVGEGALVLPHAVLIPGSRVGPGETWGGTPARPVSRDEMQRLRESIGKLS